MGLNLLRIQAFLAVAESRNISRAAAQLEVAQSVVSRHLRALEDELGCRLFARTGRGVTPTDAAERLAPRLRTAIEDMERATREASDAAEQPSGVVRLGVIPAAARPLVGLLYQRVSQRWPRLSLQFVESFSNTLDDELAAGALDIAVVNRFGRRLRPGEEPLVTVPSHVIGPPGVFEGTAREISLKGLARLPLVLAARPNGLRVELDHLCRHHGLSLQVAVESNSLLVMKDLMVQGACTPLLPVQAVDEELRHGLLDAAKLVRPGMPRTLAMIVAGKGPRSSAVATVARELREIVQGTLVPTAAWH